MGSAPTRLSLLVESKTVGQRDIEKLNKSINRYDASIQRLTKSNKGANTSQDSVNRSLNLGTRGYVAITAATVAYVAVLGKLVIASAKYAARTEALGVVVEQLARVNNINVEATNAQVDAIRRLGITTQNARQVVSRMIFAQLDLRRSTDLARLAQNAAIIAQKDSSEALQGLIHGITTRQTEVLRTYGIVVTFEEEFARVRRERGRELTAQEKTQIAFNRVLAEGSKIAGTYEAAMTTVGKRMTSLNRLVAEARNAYGQQFNPILTRTVLLLERLAAAATGSAGGLAQATIGGTALAAALAGAKFAPGGAFVKGGAAAVFGLGTYFGLDYLNDPVESARLLGSGAIAPLEKRQRQINLTLEGGAGRAVPLSGADVARLRGEFGDINTRIDAIVSATARSIAQALKGEGVFSTRRFSTIKQRLATEGFTGPLQLGTGRRAQIGVLDVIREAEALRAQQSATPGTEPLFNVQAAEEVRRAAAARDLAARVATDAKQIARFVSQFASEGASELQKLILAEAAFINRLQAPAAGQVQRARDLFSTARLGTLPLGTQTPAQRLALEGGIPGVPLGLRGAVAPGAQTAEVAPGFTFDSGAVFGLAQRRLRTRQNLISGTAGPGDEVAAVREVTRLRLQGLQLARAAGSTMLEIEVRRGEILADQEIQLHQLRMNNLEQYRQSVVGAFQALLGGGRSGISSFLRSQGIGILSSLAGNAAGIAGGGLGVIPNRGIMGRLFQGTPFLAAGGGGGGNTAAGLRNLPLNINQTAATSNVLGIGSQATGAASGGLGLMSTLTAAVPYLALAAPLIGLVGSLLPDTKARRGREIDIQIESAQVTVAGPTEFHFTSEGGGFDRDFRGGIRSMPAPAASTGSPTAVFRDSITSGEFDEDLRARVLGDG